MYSNLNKACGKLYAAIINNINIDILKKLIKFDLTINYGGEKTSCVLEIKNISSFLWLEKDKYAHESYDFSKCDYYELTSVFIEKITINTENNWINQYPMEYNVVIEIWETALLINATELSIDNQHFFIPCMSGDDSNPLKK